MREHIFNQRKQQEDQLMKRPKTAASGPAGYKSNLKNGKRIEDRLIDQKKKQEEKIEQLKRDRLMEEMSEVREVPHINTYRNDLYGQDMRVEDRLMNIGKMWKERKERLIVESFDSVA